MKDNIDRLLEAVEHPGKLSDAELGALLETSEAAEIYDMMRKASDALADTTVPDVDAEWRRFSTIHRRPGRNYFFSRPAAAVAGVLIASLAVVAASLGIKYSMDRRDNAGIEEMPIAASAVAMSVSDSIVAEKTAECTELVFRDTTLEEIIDSFCSYYGATAVFRNNDAKKLRLYFKWNQAQTLNEVVDQLNSFGQINIVLKDNSIIVD